LKVRRQGHGIRRKIVERGKKREKEGKERLKAGGTEKGTKHVSGTILNSRFRKVSIYTGEERGREETLGGEAAFVIKKKVIIKSISAGGVAAAPVWEGGRESKTLTGGRRNSSERKKNLQKKGKGEKTQAVVWKKNQREHF